MKHIERQGTHMDVLDLDYSPDFTHKTFWTYDGSILEPPCTEGVTWFVQSEIETASKEQLAEFWRVMNVAKAHGNSRPTNPRNGRPIAVCGVANRCT
eukprot:NODE_5436_length_408_cov_54.144847_g4751_i0.p1 GENE.NODE_5436_length_408_cov_54.144847_g4751_i0~~NODE_5436_length_408_cov_54.144847_g4751_i0.p1  ORF type:complete len:97 (+),score=27.87 NODE_5436_length_408_cov_54.144847_g4751_i0:39-329(+)